MGSEEPRRSDRVYLELEIVISGTDASGRDFVDETRTLVLTRHGAKIVSKVRLVPEQVLLVLCRRTRIETEARVVGRIGEDPEGSYYGIELLALDVNLWGIEFPPLAEPESVAGRVLLECPRCHWQEVTYLDVFALEVLLAQERLTRRCPRCHDSTLWRRAEPREVNQALPAPAPAALPQVQLSRNNRKYERVNLKIKVSVRHPKLGEEVTVTEDVSRGGFRFRSAKQYPVGSIIEFALPYSPGGGNIFASAKIVHAEKLQTEGISAYGVSYVSSGKDPSLR